MILRTVDTGAQEVYWPRMNQDVKEYVESCQTCQQQKIERSKPPGLTGTSPKVNRPFEVMSADLIGPFPRSSLENEYIHVTVDYFLEYIF